MGQFLVPLDVAYAYVEKVFKKVFLVIFYRILFVLLVIIFFVGVVSTIFFICGEFRRGKELSTLKKDQSRKYSSTK